MHACSTLCVDVGRGENACIHAACSNINVFVSHALARSRKGLRAVRAMHLMHGEGAA